MYGFIIRYKKTTLSRGFSNGSPSRARLPIKFLTEFFCRPGSRFLPCAPGFLTRTNKNIAPPFSPYRRQSSLPALGLPLRMLATTRKQCGSNIQKNEENLPSAGPHIGHKKTTLSRGFLNGSPSRARTYNLPVNSRSLHH